MPALGLDIGGANLKAALASGVARTLPFALWREPEKLTERLTSLLRDIVYDQLAVTMTAELCDCFATKRVGVGAILDAIAVAAPTTPTRYWSTPGGFVSAAAARSDPWRVASANWHALATFAGRFAPTGPALLIDIGTTTTDIIPLQDGIPDALGATDPERLQSGELVYSGVCRTPLCSLLGMTAAAELFATTRDVYLLLGLIPEDPEDRDTADGRPATADCAHARLARMWCSDVEEFETDEAVCRAQDLFEAQAGYLARQVLRVVERSEEPRAVIVSGRGEFLARRVLTVAELSHNEVISLEDRIGETASEAACAYALANLADESKPV